MIIKRKKRQEEVIESQPVTPNGDEPELQQEAEVDSVENAEIQEEPQQPVEDEEIDLFNLDNIDFKQRQERRRGDRRRGFRRIDDRNLISRAREEADSIKEAAAKEGYQAGLESAQADIAQLKESLKAFMSAKQEIFDYIAPDILEISVDIAKKIIKKELSHDPQQIIDSIIEILKTLSKEESKVTIRVNPTQVSIVKQEMPSVLEQAGLDAKILVVPDETMSEGGCMVTTTNGVIDATIETQIGIICEALKEVQ